jgi:serine protease Do
MVRDVIAQLRTSGMVRRGYVGVNIQPVTDDIAEGMGLPSAAGALISNVTPNGPAAKAGIRTGDIILGFDGKKVPDPRTLSRIAAATQIGRTVNVDVLRNRQHLTLRLTVQRLNEAAPKPLKAPPPRPKSKMSQLGLSLSPLSGDARNAYRVPGDVQGVVVTDVEPDSPADEKNVRAGDVIVAVANQPWRTSPCARLTTSSGSSRPTSKPDARWRSSSSTAPARWRLWRYDSNGEMA